VNPNFSVQDTTAQRGIGKNRSGVTPLRVKWIAGMLSEVVQGIVSTAVANIQTGRQLPESSILFKASLEAKNRADTPKDKKGLFANW